MTPDKHHAIGTAQAWLKEKPLYLDTETTGLGSKDQIVEIALLDHDGTPLLNTLVQPTVEISPKAAAIHGLSMADVASAPLFGEVLPALINLTQDRLVIIYNAAFDRRLLRQSAKAHQIRQPCVKSDVVCAMAAYAQYYGEWNQWSSSYRWQSQANAAKQLGLELPADLHRAAADADLCRRIVEAMAATEIEGVTA